jgi:hypothetical protein
MRRSVLAAIPLALVLASPTLASDHLMLVNEVFPSATASEEFVELRDPVPEPFPASSYTVAVYDAGGAQQDAQTFATQPHPFANSTQPFVIGQGGDAQSELDLPGGTAQICFQQGTRLIHCIGYGNVTNPVKAGMPIAQTPPPGQSVQLQAPCGSAAPAAPTRDAANAVVPGACPGSGAPPPGGGAGGGGGGAGGGGGGGAQDLTPPRQKLGGRKRQDVDRLAVTVTLDEPGRVTVRGSVNVPGGAARLVRFKSVTRTVAADTPVKVRLRLGRQARRSVKRTLRRGRALRARVTVAAVDTAGNPSTAKRTIRLTD